MNDETESVSVQTCSCKKKKNLLNCPELCRMLPVDPAKINKIKKKAFLLNFNSGHMNSTVFLTYNVTLPHSSHLLDIWSCTVRRLLCPISPWLTTRWPTTPAPPGWSSTWESTAMVCTRETTPRSQNSSRRCRGWQSSVQVVEGEARFMHVHVFDLNCG